MRVLHITPVYEPAWHRGGVVRSVSQLCRGLVRQGLEVTVFTTDFGQNSVSVNRPITVGGVEVYYFKTDFKKFGYSRSLKDACRRFIKSFDLVHITSLWWYPEIAAGLEARKQRRAYIVSPTGGLTEYSLAQKALKKELYLKLIGNRILKNADALHFTTGIEKEQSEPRRMNVPSFIIPGGIDTDEFRELPDQITARKETGLPADKLVILFLGRLHAVKNLAVLIRAFAKVLAKNPNLLLIIAGPDNGEESLLKQLASDLGILTNVSFPGYISPDNRILILRSADLFVLVSLHENFGNAPVEAMLAGIPVLISENVGICKEVLADKSGIVVIPEVEEIAQAISQMISNPDKLREMGQVAAASARSRYGINVVAEKMATAYQDVLMGKRSPGLYWSDF